MRLKIDCKEKTTVETEAEKTVPVEETEKEEEQETEKNNAEQVNQKEKQKEEAEDLIGQYRDLLKKENREKGEAGSSSLDELREIDENWGMQFSKSVIRDSYFIINSNSKESGKKNRKNNILGTMNDREILEWSSEHYKDYIFAVFLAVCVLDCQVYEDILQMGRELQDILEAKNHSDSTDTDIWNYKSRIRETLGLVEYRDKIYVRGTEQEADFLRLPSHEQSGYYIRLLIKEFPELKLMLGPYLVSKIFDTCRNRRNYLVVGGCTEALANIGNEDVLFFNTQILHLFLVKRTDEADYCLAMLLKQMYLMEQNRKYVITCAEQWGRITNNPHYPLTVLYLCGMLKDQEDFVWGVWETLLDTLLKEIMDGEALAENSYYLNLLEFFRSGNRQIGYYKGVIHAFYHKSRQMEKERKREKLHLLETLFLLLVMYDYDSCDLSCSLKRRRDMLWVELMEQMDGRTGRELTFLWAQALNNRKQHGEGWHILQMYLDKYESWDENDVGRLAFFFYWINQMLGNNQACSFLKKCMLKKQGRLLIAEKIYKRIMEESKRGR